MAEIKKRDIERSGTFKQILNPDIVIITTDNPPLVKLIAVSTYRDLPKNNDEKEKAKREKILFDQPTIECEIVMKPELFIALTSNLLKMGTWLENKMPGEYKQWADMVGKFSQQLK